LFKGNANELRTVRHDPFHPGVLPRVFWAGVMMARLSRFIFGLCLSIASGVVVADSYVAKRLDGTGSWTGASPVGASTAACKALWPPSGSWTMVGQPSNPYPQHECRHGAI